MAGRRRAQYSGQSGKSEAPPAVTELSFQYAQPHTADCAEIQRCPLAGNKRGPLNTHYDPRANEAKLAVFVGTKYNLAHIAGMLGIQWRMADLPQNMVVPGSVLLLELWENNGQQEVRARFFSQTPQGMHSPFDDETARTEARAAQAKDAEATQASTHAPVSAAMSTPAGKGAALPLALFKQTVATATRHSPIPEDYKAPLRTSEKR